LLDTIDALAFAVHSNKGAFSLLLGSGVSRSSGVPTGWEIVLELVGKVARLSKEDCGSDPEAWYFSKFGKQPDYGELLDMVARTPNERRELLQPYFEPTPDEREQGAKMPTPAHRAIAKLMAAGYVGLVVTTNFDRLMERALEEEGISPVVLSSTDQIMGAVPLTHLRCCVVKVHGDYLDTRIRNTSSELESYDTAMTEFLSRVFDEFGLVTCGWSAEWDIALRAAIDSAPSRRYSTYWASRGEPGRAAKDLLGRRGGEVINIDGADEFFVSLQAKVESIEDFSKPHPLSREIAVASAKRFLRTSEHRIQLSDLVDGLAKNLVQQISTGEFADQTLLATTESVTRRMRAFDAVSTLLVAVSFTYGRWGDERSTEVLARARNRIYKPQATGGHRIWLDLQYCCAAKVTYAAMLGASLNKNVAAMSALLKGKLSGPAGERAIAELVPPYSFFEHVQENGRLLEGRGKYPAHVNEWFFDTLLSETGDDFLDEDEFESHFVAVELLLAMACSEARAVRTYQAWFPPGTYAYREKGLRRAKEMILLSLDEDGDTSQFVRWGLFGKSVKNCEWNLDKLVKHVQDFSFY
jgi:hypothetical protein